jgi:hypothetical protein
MHLKAHPIVPTQQIMYLNRNLGATPKKTSKTVFPDNEHLSHTKKKSQSTTLFPSI